MKWKVKAGAFHYRKEPQLALGLSEKEICNEQLKRDS